MLQFNKTTTVGAIISTSFNGMWFDLQIYSQMQHSQEFKHWYILVQATRTNWVDVTWEGLATISWTSSFMIGSLFEVLNDMLYYTI
jgi:hypothetical protein